MKTCCKCKKYLELSCFSKHKNQPDGLQGVCKECMKEYKKYHNPRLNNPLELTMKEKNELPIFNVYEHVDECGIVVYRGKGCDGRSHTATKRRQPDHSKWCLEQILKRRHYIRYAGEFLTAKEALDLEKKLNDECKPKFNR